MSDNKKYYYLKLKENFFDSEEIKMLESIENGYLYSNILLKMFLRSLKSEGRLMFRENIPYNNKMLAAITGHNIDVVDKAIKIFSDFGLIQILDGGAIYIADIQSFIGESSSEADRKRLYRLKIDGEIKSLGQMSRQMADKNPPEIEKDTELKKEIELKKPLCGKPHEQGIVFFHGKELKEPRFDNKVFELDSYLDVIELVIPPRCDKPTLTVLAKIVLKHFNCESNSVFRPVEANLSMIRGVLTTGISLRECFEVNEKMVAKWGNDQNMKQYLRIKTIYAKSNFEQYLSEVFTENSRRKR